MPGRRATRVGRVGGVRRASHRYIHRPYYRPYYRRSPYGIIGYWGSSRIITYGICALVIVFFVLISFISAFVTVSGESLKEGDWIYGDGIASYNQPISYSISASDNKFVFFLTKEDPISWGDVFRVPTDRQRYSDTMASIEGEFTPLITDMWFFVIYNDPNFHQGSITVTYDVQYSRDNIHYSSGSTVNMDLVILIVIITLICAVIVGFIIYQRKQRNSKPIPSARTRPIPPYRKSQSIPRPVIIPTSRTTKARYCNHCGNKLEPGDIFCVECGKKVN